MLLYRDEINSLQIQLGRTQAGPGRAVKEQKSPNHVQRINLISVQVSRTFISFCTMVETRESERIHLCADSIVASAHTVADVRCAPTVKPLKRAFPTLSRKVAEFDPSPLLKMNITI